MNWGPSFSNIFDIVMFGLADFCERLDPKKWQMVKSCRKTPVPEFLF